MLSLIVRVVVKIKNIIYRLILFQIAHGTLSAVPRNLGVPLNTGLKKLFSECFENVQHFEHLRIHVGTISLKYIYCFGFGVFITCRLSIVIDSAPVVKYSSKVKVRSFFLFSFFTKDYI